MHDSPTQDSPGTMVIARYGPFLVYDERVFMHTSQMGVFPIAVQHREQIIKLPYHIPMDACLIPDFLGSLQNTQKNIRSIIQMHEETVDQIKKALNEIESPLDARSHLELQEDLVHKEDLIADQLRGFHLIESGIQDVLSAFPQIYAIPGLPPIDPKLIQTFQQANIGIALSNINFISRLPRAPVPITGRSLWHELSYDIPRPSLAGMCDIGAEVTRLGPFVLYETANCEFNTLDPSPYYVILLHQLGVAPVEVGLIGCAESDANGIYQRLRVCVRTFFHALKNSKKAIRPGITPKLLERAPIVIPPWEQQYETIKTAFEALVPPAGMNE